MGRDRTPVVDSPRAVAEDIARPHRWLNGQGQNRLQEARLWHAIQICFRSSSRNRSLARSPYRRLNEFRLATSARLWAAASRHQFIGLLRDSSPSVRNSSRHGIHRQLRRRTRRGFAFARDGSAPGLEHRAVAFTCVSKPAICVWMINRTSADRARRAV